MFSVDKNRLIQILTAEYGFTTAKAKGFVEDFPPLHDELREVLDTWLENRTVLDFEVDGVSLKSIMEIQRYHFLLAIREVNRLLDPALDGAKRQRMIELLKRPVPRW